MRSIVDIGTITASGLCLAAAAFGAAPADTAFTYQGRLKLGGTPVNEAVDLKFTLYDAASDGGIVGTTQVFDGRGGNSRSIDVVNGLFTVQLDFGTDAFSGEARWLQVEVRSPHDPTDTEPYITLSPRQSITMVPYAIHALNGYGTGDGHSLDASDGTPIDVVYVDHVGNVGIKTTSPDTTLDVNGSIRVSQAGGRIDLEGAKNQYAGIETYYGKPDDRYGMTQAPGGNLALYTAGWYWPSFISFNLANTAGTFDELMRITHVGDVGIGMTSPAAKLDVAGAVAVNGNEVIDANGHWVGDPSGLVGPPGPPGPAVTTVAVCVEWNGGPSPPTCAQTCTGRLIAWAFGPCSVTSDTGPCELSGSGVCCVCEP